MAIHSVTRARLSTDAATSKSLVGDALALLVQNTSTLVCGLLVAFLASWQLSLIILAVAPIISLNGILRMKFNKGFSANAEVCLDISIKCCSLSVTFEANWIK